MAKISERDNSRVKDQPSVWKIETKRHKYDLCTNSN